MSDDDALFAAKAHLAAAQVHITPSPPMGSPDWAAQFAGMTTEFAPGVVRGVRSWAIGSGDLHGLSVPVPWVAGENRAACYSGSQMLVMMGVPYLPSIGSHRAPDPTCECGFYAYFDLSGKRPPGPGYGATGVIEAYGRVLIGTRGFRAEKARIVALAVDPSLPAVFGMPMIRNRYRNIPIFNSYEQMIAEFPPDDANSFASGRKPDILDADGKRPEGR